MLRVRYPGFGAIVSFELADAAAADRACVSTDLVTPPASAAWRRRWSAATPTRARTTSRRLIRLSVGCEDAEDLWRDLEQALNGL